MISGDGKRVPRWDETFSNSQVTHFGDVVETDADLIWLKLNPFDPAEPQIGWLKKHFKQHFIVMSSIPNIREAMVAINAGARAYINAHAGPNNLKQVIRVIDDHGIWIGEDLMQLMVGQLASQSKKDSSDQPKKSYEWKLKLSDREIEVVNAVIRGLSNKLIARDLNISERTVKAHLTSIFEKLEVQDRLKLVLLATK